MVSNVNNYYIKGRNEQEVIASNKKKADYELIDKDTHTSEIKTKRIGL